MAAVRGRTGVGVDDVDFVGGEGREEGGESGRGGCKGDRRWGVVVLAIAVVIGIGGSMVGLGGRWTFGGAGFGGFGHVGCGELRYCCGAIVSWRLRE